MDPYAARIRAARAYAGLTREELAERLGVAISTIDRREAGTHAPKRGELLAIAAICGVPPAFMEHGFGEINENEILRRLDRIEAAVGVDEIDFEPIHDQIRSVITELRLGVDSAESPEPIPPQASEPRSADTPVPRVQRQRRS